MRRNKVFISYASEDRLAVQQFVKVLTGQGVEIWFDVEQIDPGDDLIDRLNQGLAQGVAAILFSSQRYWEKNYTRAEYRALTQLTISQPGHRLIIVRLDDSDIPPLLASKIQVQPHEAERVARTLGATERDATSVGSEVGVSLETISDDDIEEVARSLANEGDRQIRGDPMHPVECVVATHGHIRLELRPGALTRTRLSDLKTALEISEVHRRYIAKYRKDLFVGGLGTYEEAVSIRLDERLLAGDEVRRKQIRPLVDLIVKSVARSD